MGASEPVRGLQCDKEPVRRLTRKPTSGGEAKRDGLMTSATRKCCPLGGVGSGHDRTGRGRGRGRRPPTRPSRDVTITEAAAHTSEAETSQDGDVTSQLTSRLFAVAAEAALEHQPDSSGLCLQLNGMQRLWDLAQLFST